ncbi:sulfite exporter TauE/SafE family protein [Patescibacteria group bacterium]
MLLAITLTLIFITGILAGFVGALGGPGGLISLPFLIFTGLPPHIAIATNKFGNIGMKTSVLLKLWKKKKIIWNYILPLSIAAIIGAFIGTTLLIKSPPEIITKIIGIVILLTLPIIFIKKDLGIKRKQTGKIKKVIGYIFYLTTRILSGFLEAGTGPLTSFILMIFFGFTIIESIATSKIPGIILSIVSLTILASNGIINYFYGAILLVGMLIGGYLGARIAIKKGDRWVKMAFGVIIVISAIKLVFF